MANGKWITQLRGDMPVEEAASAVLGARWRVVQRYLGLAAKKPEADIEYVHQLRVGTRRAAAAVRIFKSCLPRKRSKDARKRLRQIRRAAGRARDWDVFQQQLLAWSSQRPAGEKAGIDLLHGIVCDERGKAQEEVVAAAEHAEPLAKILDHIVSPKDRGAVLADLALPALNKLQAALEEAIEADTGEYEPLHRVRIAGKRLRYAMEVFACCFPLKFRTEAYAAIEEMQEILGAANDCHTAIRRLTEMRQSAATFCGRDWKRFRPGIDRWLRHLQRQMPAFRRRFAAWVKRWRRLKIHFGEMQSPAPARKS